MTAAANVRIEIVVLGTRHRGLPISLNCVELRLKIVGMGFPRTRLAAADLHAMPFERLKASTLDLQIAIVDERFGVHCGDSSVHALSI